MHVRPGKYQKNQELILIKYVHIMYRAYLDSFVSITLMTFWLIEMMFWINRFL